MEITEQRIAVFGGWRQLLSAATVLMLTFMSWAALQVSQLQIADNSVQVEPVREEVVAAEVPVPEPIVQVPPSTPVTNLEAALASYIAKTNGDVAVYVEDLTTGETLTHNADNIYKSASLYKLFVANEVYKQVDQGAWSLNAVIDEERGYTLDTCLSIMITVSDNPCGVILQRMTGAVNRLLPQLETQGFVDTDLRGYYPATTASDVGQFFKNLHNQAYLNPESNAALLGLLERQQINNRLPQQLPDGVVVAHKTGELEGFVHDAGIVYGRNGPFIIALMSGPSTELLNERHADMAAFSRDVYNILSAEN